MRVFARRIGFYVMAAMVAITLDFFIPRLVPGDPAAAIFAKYPGLPPQAYQALRQQMGLDTHEGLWTQYTHYWNEILHGNLGTSFQLNEPVSTVIGQHLWWTVILVGVSTVLSFIVGTIVGTIAAWKRGSWLEALLPVTTFFQAIPYFFLATLLLLFFGFDLQWFPTLGGYTTFQVEVGLNWPFISDAIYHALLPAATIIGASLAGWIIGMRNMVVTVRDEDYVLLGEAEGLSNRRVIWYAVRNAVLPQISAFSLALSFVVAGSLLTEIVFSYPGLGFTLLQAVLGQDYQTVQGIFLVITLVVLAVNLIMDVIYTFIDPRTRAEA